MNDEINIKTPGQILDYVDTKEHLLSLFNYITNLQQRIDKAIEYIEYLDKNIEWADDIDFGDLECIKNILLGGDE